MHTVHSVDRYPIRSFCMGNELNGHGDEIFQTPCFIYSQGSSRCFHIWWLAVYRFGISIWNSKVLIFRAKVLRGADSSGKIFASLHVPLGRYCTWRPCDSSQLRSSLAKLWLKGLCHQLKILFEGLYIIQLNHYFLYLRKWFQILACLVQDKNKYEVLAFFFKNAY